MGSRVDLEDVDGFRLRMTYAGDFLQDIWISVSVYHLQHNLNVGIVEGFDCRTTAHNAALRAYD